MATRRAQRPAPTVIFFWFPSSRLGTFLVQSSALLNSRQSVGYIPVAKLELGARCVPKLELGNERNNAKAPSIHLTLTTDYWQLITAFPTPAIRG